MSGIPVLLRGVRLRALVVGGGAVGTRKALALFASGATVRVVAPEIAPALREAAAGSGGRLTLAERAYDAADLGDANLVVAAASSRSVNAAVARDADAAGRLACVADEPDDGAWTSMAAHRTGALVLGVSAGGVPGAAARVRDALASRFDGRYAHAVHRLAAVRGELLARGEAGRWRAVAARVVGPDFCADVAGGAIDGRLADAVTATEEGAWR